MVSIAIVPVRQSGPCTGFFVSDEGSLIKINESIEELKKVCLAHGSFTAINSRSWRCRIGSIGRRAIQGRIAYHQK